MKKYFLNGCLAVALVLLAGCVTPIGADKVSPRQAYQHLHENALNSSRCSSDTMRVLNRYGLDEAFQKNPDATLAKLQAIACADDRRDLLFALSELNYLNADRQGRSVKPGVPRLARNSYFASAIYAYLYLLGEGKDARPNLFDLRIRTAGDLYNRGLAQGLMVNTNALVELASGPRQTPPGVVEVQFTQPGFPWDMNMIKAFYSADEYVVRGLSTRNRDSGLGAPLIAVTGKFGKFKESVRAPVTVFLRVSGDARDWSAGKLTATLELYSTFDAAHVDVNGKQVPLQTDTTAPIAQGLNNSPIWKLGIAQFFSAELQNKTGTRRMEPYTPGQIPVVFVHGTASSPVWWAEMWNTLNADPVLRSRYQFWMFNYASGKPITMSAGILRNDLMNLVKTLDPEGKDAALRHMVVIGHSQGGLLAKLTATDTGDKLWQLVSKTNIDALDIDVPTRDLLRSNFFFKPLPCVSRVIFIATPHRGSYQNTSFVQNLLNRFMSFPSDLVEASASLMKLNDTLNLPPSLRKGVPSSLNGMATDNPFMLTLADIPVAPDIKANSIIAIKGDDQPPNGADGVVQYTSAHVDYTESEFIVRSGHSCQMNPLTIEEVRRILLENLGETKPAFR
ncbi:MAG: alpha/beta fold hydrolase [Verrucomicrobiales bacterium]|nr:alpha/beta fold hydrolase [Verrucomicrobiales bacterium]